VPTAALRPTSLQVYAANGTPIPVLGSTRLGFTVQNMIMHADFLISDDVDEIMLGIDWLTENGCKWHFERKEIEVRGRPVALKSRPSLATVRRVWVRENVCVSPGTQTNVPVKLTWNSWPTPSADWVVEAKRWRPGVFAARTLLSDNSKCAAVRIANTSGFPFHLTKGRFVGDAKIAESAEEKRPSTLDESGPGELGCSRGTGTDRSNRSRLVLV